MTQTNIAILTVQGMSCTSCASRVERGLNAIQGISGVSVDFKASKVHFNYKSSALLDKATGVLSDLGYPAQVA
ncbi:MAG: heavy metal-associated domain-containing protein [Pseudomonadota bacterium]|nr:heavy metal-associated domain-containing protein [Pseudomonadota bacterium]